MTIEVVPLSPAIGAEIRGVDLTKPIDAATKRAVYQAWLDNVIVLFRGQNLAEMDQIRFTEIFGTPGIRPRPKEFRAESDDLHPATMLISNIRENGKPIGSLPDGEMMFHHDMMHIDTPDKATLLYAIEVPSVGGNTMFANMYKAYETLPQRLKDKLAGRRAYVHYHYGSTQRGDGKGTPAFGKSEHPVVWTHPETGRKAVYMNRLMTHHIIDMDPAESEALIAAVCDHCENRAFVYEHRWRPGDLVMWDNRCSTHARTDFPETERRLLRRTTVQGQDRPVEAAA
ncbi:MAG: TauD/TfdA dioxygenase family protein [Rhodospirillales bacterium]